MTSAASSPKYGMLSSGTTFGAHLVAAGANRAAARLRGAGLPGAGLGYAISGVLAATAGVLATARLGAGDPANTGLLFELSAITAVVVGGTPLSGGQVRIAGTVAGAVLMQPVSATLIKNNLPNSSALMVQAVIDHRRGVGGAGERTMSAPVTTVESAGAAQPRVRRQLVGSVLQRQGAAVVLALVVVGAWVALPRFGSVDNLRDVALQSSFLAVIALGMTFVIITGGIDLSVGSVYVARRRARRVGSRYGSWSRCCFRSRSAVCSAWSTACRRAGGLRAVHRDARGAAVRPGAAAGADVGGPTTYPIDDRRVPALGRSARARRRHPVWIAVGAVRPGLGWCCIARASASPSSRSAAPSTRRC